MVLLPDAPHCAMVTLNGLNQTTKWQNKLHFQYPAGTTLNTTMILALISGVESAWSAQIAPLCNTNVTLTSGVGVDLNSRQGVTFTSSFVTPPVGTRAGVAMPAQTALTASWIIQNRYRGGHPRTYFPGGVLADVVNGHTWTTTFSALAAVNFGNFITALNGITSGAVTFTFICLSYFSGSHKVPGQPPPAPVLRPVPLAFPIQATVVHPRIDTQRRRLGKEVP